MAVFPRKETEIKSLAQNLVTGLTDNPGVYPAPPVPPGPLQALLDSVITLGDEAVASRALAKQTTETKFAALEELVDAMKANFRYAEDTVNYNDAQLSLIGWAGKAAPTPNVLELPGQARTLEAPRQGEGWVFLDWKEPLDGGLPASYKIERRERPAGEWMIAAMAIESEATVNNQERGKDWEYRVSAVNAAGEGMASNTVAVVL
jgi:hypothetical protein